MKIIIEEDGKPTIVKNDVVAYLLSSVEMEYGTKCLMTTQYYDTQNNPNGVFQFLSCIKQTWPDIWAKTEKYYQPSEIIYKGPLINEIQE